MLKKLELTVTSPKDNIMRILAQVNGAPINAKITVHCDGVYENPNYPYNGDSWLRDMDVDILDKWTAYGVADNYKQILAHYPAINDPDKIFVITLTKVEKSNQSEQYGWRWHKWGEYIGTQNPQHEYLYDEPDIETVYCYNIYQVE